MGSVPRSINRLPPPPEAAVADDEEGDPAEYLALVLAAASAEGSSEGETSSSAAAELEDLEGVRSRYCCCSILSYLFIRRLLTVD